MTTAIKPVLKYPGAKWNCAAWIISHFPAHQHYVEPFFGSGAVFFNKAPAKHEVINDLSGDVVNLFRVIREQGEELAALIEMTPWAREEYELSYEPCEDALERARRFLVRSWMGYGMRLRPGGSTWIGHVKRSGTGDTSARNGAWLSLSERILEMPYRLRLALIERTNAVKLISESNDKDTLIYADPPYVISTRQESKFYEHEMTDAHHAALLDALDAHPGPVVLSGYHCALYDTRLAHWQTREKQVQAEKGNTRTEVLWLNQVCVERLGFGPLWG